MINTAELCRGINGPRLQHCQRTLTKYFVRPVISGLFQRMSKTRRIVRGSSRDGPLGLGEGAKIREHGSDFGKP
jgi:hypothetical protein